MKNELRLITLQTTNMHTQTHTPEFVWYVDTKCLDAHWIKEIPPYLRFPFFRAEVIKHHFVLLYTSNFYGQRCHWMPIAELMFFTIFTAHHLSLWVIYRCQQLKFCKHFAEFFLGFRKVCFVAVNSEWLFDGKSIWLALVPRHSSIIPIWFGESVWKWTNVRVHRLSRIFMLHQI